MGWVRGIVLCGCVFVGTLSCQSESGSKQAKAGDPDQNRKSAYTWDRQKVSQDNAPLEYTWVDDRKRCENGSGQVGYNLNRLVQCGKIENSDLSFTDAVDQDLRGLQIINCRAEYMRFDGSDLRHARFQALLNGSQFHQSDIRSIYFDRLPDHYLQFSSQSFKAARINHESVTYPLNVLQLEKLGAVYESAYPAQSTPPRADGVIISFDFDQNFSAGEKSMFMDDLHYLSQLNYDLPAGSALGLLFGQGRGPEMVQFIDQRVERIVSQTQEKQESAGIIRSASNAFAKGLFESLEALFNETDALSRAAENYFNSQSRFTKKPKFTDNRESLNGRKVNTESREDTLINLHAHYMRLTPESRIERLSTLMHEARHSDCDLTSLQINGMRGDEFLRVYFSESQKRQEQLVDLMAQLPKNYENGRKLTREQLKVETLAFQAKRDLEGMKPFNNAFINAFQESGIRPYCGYQHVDCPMNLPNKDYQGAKDACDSSPWGSYAVGALFAKGLAENCSNCSESEKQVALATFVDSWSRLLYNGDELLSGQLGPPNLNGI